MNNSNTKSTTTTTKNNRRSSKWAIIAVCAIVGFATSIGVVNANWNGDKSEENIVEDIGGENNIIESEELVVEAPYTEYELPYNGKYGGFKSYESYMAITDEDSKQYELQTMAWTDENAFRKVGGYYLVAIGSHFNAPVGTVIDVVLANGMVIPCVVGDIKADEHTDSTYHIWSDNGCATEFIVDARFTKAQTTGDVSYIFENWQSAVVKINVYEDNILD